MDIDLLKKLQSAMAGQDNGDVMSPEAEQIEAVNEQAKSDNLKTSEDLANEAAMSEGMDVVSDTPDAPLDSMSPETDIKTVSPAKTPTEREEYKKLIDAYKSKLDAKPESESGDTAMNWMTAAGQVANIMNRDANRDDSPVQYWGDKIAKGKAKTKKEGMSGLQELQKMYQNYEKMGKKDDMTDYQKNNLDIQKRRLDLIKGSTDVREKSLGLREEKFSDKKVQKQQDDAVKAIDSLRKTETWKSAEKAVSNIPEITVLLDDAYNEGGQSLAMLGPRVAKGIAGEVGVLTEQDVTRYVKNPELVGGMLDTMSKLKSGKITEASYENLKRLLEISKQTARAKLDAAIDREAILLSRREKIPFEDAKYLLDAAYKVSPEEKVEKKDTVMESKVKSLMDRNKGLSRERAIKALKSKGLI